MVRVKKVGHVVLGVHDVAASTKFYKEVLGMEVVNTLSLDDMQMAMLSFGERDHDIALLQVPKDQIVGSPGFSHTALEIDGGEAELHELYRRLKKFGIQVEMAADHVAMKSIYFLDPDGNRLELYTQVMEQAAAKEMFRQAKTIADFIKPLEFGA